MERSDDIEERMYFTAEWSYRLVISNLLLCDTFGKTSCSKEILMQRFLTVIVSRMRTSVATRTVDRPGWNAAKNLRRYIARKLL